jgi:hypothetical protein
MYPATSSIAVYPYTNKGNATALYKFWKSTSLPQLMTAEDLQ